MKFTRSQKICFGLLGAGLIALVADRSFGGAGEAIAAVTASPTATVAAEATPAGAAPAAGPSLAARLRSLVSDDLMAKPVADAFKTSVVSPAPESPTADAPATDAATQAFKSGHALKAVLGGGRAGRVLLGDRLLAVGESVGGFELVDVRERHAVFAGPAGRVTIELPAPSVGR